jgi:isopentenyl-diphosphate delta-isomerase
MKKVTKTSSRKADHIRINLEEEVSSRLTTGLERYAFVHEALPEINLSDITISQPLFGKTLHSPLIISSMTGGTEEARKINLNLAQAAERTGIAMGVGSQRAAIENPSLAPSFQIRSAAPTAILFANLGAIQLNYGYSLDECKQAIDMIEADALILHLNSIQEAVQPEGDTNFKGLLSRIAEVCSKLSVPVIAKEVGWGFSAKTARALFEAGITAIDIAGAGGTSWSQVEMYRAKTQAQKRLAEIFIDWGIPTADSIIQVREEVPDLILFASGGLRSGMDIAKTITLGAIAGGMASPFLKAAVESSEHVINLINELSHQIKVSMFGAGLETLDALKQAILIKR